MRRPNSAFSVAVLALGLSAPIVSAQYFRRVPATTSETNQTRPQQNKSRGFDINNAPAATSEADQARAATSFDPMTASRNARHLLRNGLDYINYKEYGRALRYLRAAEARQGELEASELQTLKSGIELAQRGLRETESPGAVAGRSRSRPAGAIAAARPTNELLPPAPSRSFDTVQLTSATQPEPTPGPALDRGAATVPVQADPPTPIASAAAPVELPEPPGRLPEPSPNPAPATAPELSDPALSPASAAPVPEPSPDPAKADRVELPPLPSEPASPTAAPAPEPLPDAKPKTTPPQPTQPLEPKTEPTPAPAPEARNEAPPVLSLEPLPETPAPSPQPSAPAETKPAAPADLPAPPPTETKPSAPADLPAPSPDPAPAELPAPSGSGLLPPLPELPPAQAEAKPAAPGDLPPLPTTSTPDATPASAPAPAPEPVSAATSVPTPDSLAMVKESTPTPPVAPSADELPPLPGGTALPPTTVEPTAPRAENSEDSSRVPRQALSPATEEAIAQMARRQAEESQSRAGQASPLPRPVNILPEPSANDANTADNLGVAGNTSTRFELTRAPSPTEAWPIRRIPVPEEFVPFQPRNWDPARKYWQAPSFCHMPLYFQDAALERYGHSVEQFFGPAGRHLTYPIDDPKQSQLRMQIAQPFWSIGLFAFQVGTLPYKMFVDPPWEAEYDLGYYRPGDRIPKDVYYLPLHGVGQALPPVHGRNW